jgi:hypothetical protein
MNLREGYSLDSKPKNSNQAFGSLFLNPLNPQTLKLEL